MENKTVQGVILLVVSLIIIFSIVAGTSETIQSSAEDLSEANNCSLSSDINGHSPLWYNSTADSCYNGTEGSSRNLCSTDGADICNNVHGAEKYNLPLAGLFAPSGVVLLIFMVGIFIGIVTLVLKKKRG